MRGMDEVRQPLMPPGPPSIAPLRPLFPIDSRAYKMVALTLQTVAARPALAQRKQQRVQARRSLLVRAQATATAAPPAKGEIKDKNAELAINGASAARSQHSRSQPRPQLYPGGRPSANARSGGPHHALPGCLRSPPG